MPQDVFVRLDILCMYVCMYVYVDVYTCMYVCVCVYTFIRKRLSDLMLEYASQEETEMRTNGSQRDTDERERERERERHGGGRNGTQRQRSLNVLKDWYHSAANSAANSESADFVERMKDGWFPEGGRGPAIKSSHSHPFMAS